MSYNPNRPEERIEDWTILFGGDCATHNARGGDAEVELDKERGLYVRLEEGSGYMAQSCSHRIPMPVLLRLMENAGYVVKKERCENWDFGDEASGIPCNCGACP